MEKKKQTNKKKKRCKVFRSDVLYFAMTSFLKMHLKQSEGLFHLSPEAVNDDVIYNL